MRVSTKAMIMSVSPQTAMASLESPKSGKFPGNSARGKRNIQPIYTNARATAFFQEILDPSMLITLSFPAILPTVLSFAAWRAEKYAIPVTPRDRYIMANIPNISLSMRWLEVAGLILEANV